eukprot:3296803-Prymnesium_polylepis.1
MTTSLCVLALHGWVAKDGNYSEKIGLVSVVVVVAGGLAWFRRQACETDNTPQFKTENLMATRRRRTELALGGPKCFRSTQGGSSTPR